MSILIKMEMPKNCMNCPMCYDSIDCELVYEISFRNKDGEYDEFYENNRHPKCPLIEVPPHGRITNADRIRAMTDEELAKFFANHAICESCLAVRDKCGYGNGCCEAWLEWLKKEVDDGSSD